MPKIDAARLKADTTKFIRDNGENITLVKHVYGTPNIDTGVQPDTPVNIPASAIYEDDQTEDPIDGRYHVEATNEVDMFSSIIKADGKEVRIIDVKEVTSQDLVIAYVVSVASDNDLKTE